MSIFPFIDTEKTAEAGAELPILKEYAYDFEKNEMLLDKSGKTYLVEKNSALRIWIFKALTTERFHYTAHSSAYGEEFSDQLIGRSMDGDIAELEMERYITEALMVNPYIESLDNFSFEEGNAGIEVSFDCTSIYGTENITLPGKEVRF